MIKAKQVFFSTSDLKGYGFHSDKAIIFCLISEYYSLSVLSVKLYFLKISPVHHTLWPFKCMMLKTLNSNVLDYTLRDSKVRPQRITVKSSKVSSLPLLAVLSMDFDGKLVQSSLNILYYCSINKTLKIGV